MNDYAESPDEGEHDEAHRNQMPNGSGRAGALGTPT